MLLVGGRGLVQACTRVPKHFFKCTGSLHSFAGLRVRRIGVIPPKFCLGAIEKGPNGDRYARHQILREARCAALIKAATTSRNSLTSFNDDHHARHYFFWPRDVGENKKRRLSCYVVYKLQRHDPANPVHGRERVAWDQLITPWPLIIMMTISYS